MKPGKPTVTAVTSLAKKATMGVTITAVFPGNNPVVSSLKTN